MNQPLLLKLLLLAASLLPTLTLLTWDGSLTWPLFGGFVLRFELQPLGGFFLLLLAIGAPLVALPMTRGTPDRATYALFAVLLLGMQLLLLAGDFIGLFIGWEVMTWSSYLLLIRSTRATLEGAQTYILFNLASAFLLLAGLLMFYSLTGDFRIAPLTDASTGERWAVFVLLGLAFLIKVGALPLHRWIPVSYDQAPDLFSAVLAGLISKMGLYGLLLLPTLFPDALTDLAGRWLNGPAAGYGLAWIGAITAIVATFKAISQQDIKRLLAYSSVAQLGYVVTAIGVGSSLAIGGAIFQTLVHTLVKLLLFITFAGIVLQTGQRRFNDLGHLLDRMPVAFFAVLIGIIGLAGMPPLPGFAAKYLVFVGLIDARWLLLLAAMMLSSTAAFIYCYRLIYGPFLGHANSPAARTATEAPLSYLVPQVVLMGLLVLLGIFPGLAIAVIVNPVLSALGLAAIGAPSWGELATPYGGYDGVVLMTVFGTAFVSVTALFWLARGRMRRAGSPYDLSFAGEVPTAEMPLHYGAGMGRELRRIPLVGWILAQTTAGMQTGLTRQIVAAGGLLAALYRRDPQVWIQLAVLGCVVVLTVLALNGGWL